MLRLVLGVFMILHAVVYLLYFGQSARFFELQPGLAWPDGAWSFSRLMGQAAVRNLASIACVVAAIGFATGGLGILATQDWWRTVVVASAVFGVVLAVLFWDGTSRQLPNQGAVGLLINLIILAALLVFNWPPVGF
jgi:hypothetical protein